MSVGLDGTLHVLDPRTGKATRQIFVSPSPEFETAVDTRLRDQRKRSPLALHLSSPGQRSTPVLLTARSVHSRYRMANALPFQATPPRARFRDSRLIVRRAKHMRQAGRQVRA